MSQGFSINETVKPVNKDLTVTFTPLKTVSSYTYNVKKGDTVVFSKKIDSNMPSDIVLNKTGQYKIEVITNNNLHISSGVYVIDKQAPIINISSESIQIKQGDNLSNYVSATDNYDGDLTSSVINNIDALDLNQIGKHKIVYSVSDQAGNISYANVMVNVIPCVDFIFILRFIIIIIFLMLLFLIVRFRKVINLERRIALFTIKPINDNSTSSADRFVIWYRSFNRKITKFLAKSDVCMRYAKRLDKYSSISVLHESGMSIVAGKIISCLIFLLIAFISKTLQLKILSLYEFIFPLLTGFFLLDIFYFIKYRFYRNKLENDLLAAITVMNNAFKCDRSIVQAIDIVSQQLDGEIAKEFSKMSMELTYGLDISTVFKRFASRINIEEVNYLTASLTILNKTGGNITSVFDSIEKSLFNKKKLKLELKSLTSASRVIVWVLFVVPFLFVLSITIIDPTYFKPFYTTDIGMVLMFIMIVYYVIFVIFVRKIMKVVI